MLTIDERDETSSLRIRKPTGISPGFHGPSYSVPERHSTHLILPIEPELGHVLDKDDLERARDLEVIRTAQRLST